MKLSFKFISKLRQSLVVTLLCPVALVYAITISTQQLQAQTPTDSGQSLTLRSDVQEANRETGVVTARGNVRINYPARQIQATAAQAQYFINERRIVLTGNVYVLQEGNSLRGERVTYLIDEGRFVALPKDEQQVESIYIVSDPEATPQPGTK
ncbi:MAG: LptA/OstA family protein [Coleofasciculaceae cyanobacterium]